MTESEWLECSEAHPMLEFLLSRHPVAGVAMQRVASLAMRRRSGWGRKFRLFACGWSRRCWEDMPNQRLRNALEITEAYADRRATDPEFRAAKRMVGSVYEQAMAREGRDGWETHLASYLSDVMSLRFMPGWDQYRGAEITGTRSEECERHSQELASFQCNLLRDLFGPLPFRAVFIYPHCFTATVANLAVAVYDEPDLSSGHLNPERLAILSDALEEAGCDDADITNHLRSPGPHVRGCWVVDLLLGKE